MLLTTGSCGGMLCVCVCTLFNDAEICYVYIELVIDECMRMEHKRNGSDGGKPKYG